MKIAILLSVLVAALCTYTARAQNYIYRELYTLGVPEGFDPPPETYEAFGTGPGGQVVGGGSSPRSDDNNQPAETAIVWSKDTPMGVSYYPGILAQGTDGAFQVGNAAVLGSSHAALWNGSPGSLIDLNPIEAIDGVQAPWVTSNAFYVRDGQQVGLGEPPGSRNYHALVWSGTAESFVDLHPAGFSYSIGRGVGGGKQVGYAGGEQVHAFVWAGSSASAVDLHPPDYSESKAFGTDGSQQVGYGIPPSGSQRALLWTNTPQSVIVLGEGTAVSVRNGRQVGLSNGHLTVWSGTPESAVDLSSLMPSSYGINFISNFNYENTPLAFDSDGNIFGVALDTSTGYYHAFELVSTPIPKVSIVRSAAQITVTYVGVLQQSSDLSQWEDIEPQPANPWTFTPAIPRLFLQARAAAP